MFKIIGMAVFFGVLFIGYGAFQDWYTGDATPQETVTEVRKKVGEKILGEESVSSAPSKPSSPAGETPANASSPGKALDTDEMLRKMMEKK
jgi:hypothetical protein